MNKIKIVALFGKSGAGKDAIQKRIASSNTYHSIVSCTTRPARENEKNGVNYFFLTNDEFAEKVMNYEMLESTSFRGWYYGTSLDSLNQDKINIGVFNIAGIRIMMDDPRLDVLPICIDAPDKIRLMRSLNREENPDCAEICRRFQTDEADFRTIDFDYETVKNIDLSSAIEEIQKIIKYYYSIQ